MRSFASASYAEKKRPGGRQYGQKCSGRKSLLLRRQLHRWFPDLILPHVRCRDPALLLALWLLIFTFDANGWFRLSLFASACHELGHILVYRFLTGEWPEISLGFTGICMYTRQKQLPRRQELWITAAGPATNALLMLGAMLWIQQQATFRRMGWLWANLLIGLFNLLPIPPLDGWHLLKLLFCS